MTARCVSRAGRRHGGHRHRHACADQDGVQFHSLGVVVVDEQHRFGVEQRAALRAKGDGEVVPDVLVMTATRFRERR